MSSSVEPIFNRVMNLKYGLHSSLSSSVLTLNQAWIAHSSTNLIKYLLLTGERYITTNELMSWPSKPLCFCVLHPEIWLDMLLKFPKNSYVGTNA